MNIVREAKGKLRHGRHTGSDARADELGSMGIYCALACCSLMQSSLCEDGNRYAVTRMMRIAMIVQSHCDHLLTLGYVPIEV
jgi:hypothetical protein